MKIMQISDLHLFANTEEELLGVKTAESFQAVLDHLLQDKKPIDLIILSGDLSQDGSDLAYKRVASMLKVFNIPIYYAPGNHDHPKIMTHVYPRETISSHRHLILKNWHIILLNSQVQGAVHGFLDSSQLNYLQHCLQIYPEHHAMIVFHHQPVEVGSRWLDNIGLMNANEFWEIVSRYPKVKTILFGHVHQVFEQVVNGIHCYSAPSTCIQFKPKMKQFTLDKLPPGYRWLQLYEDGRLETGVVRIAHYVGVFDVNAKGY